MNTRDYKISAAGEVYHIYNRGNSKNNIFFQEEDYNFFLTRLRQNLFPSTVKLNRYNRMQLLPENSFSLLSYCLMPNHFHLLIKQNLEISPSKLILKICTSYSKYFNKKYEHVGHVFQDRFKQILVDHNDYLIWLTAYIHQNPKVSGLVTKLDEYSWSSYREYLDKPSYDLCSKELILSQFKNRKDFLDSTEAVYEIIKTRKDLEHLMLDNG